MDLQEVLMVAKKKVNEVFLRQLLRSTKPSPEASRMSKEWIIFHSGSEWKLVEGLLRYHCHHIVVVEEILEITKSYLILTADGFFIIRFEENKLVHFAFRGPTQAAEIALSMGLNAQTFIPTIREKLEELVRSV